MLNKMDFKMSLEIFIKNGTFELYSEGTYQGFEKRNKLITYCSGDFLKIYETTSDILKQYKDNHCILYMNSFEAGIIKRNVIFTLVEKHNRNL